MDFSTAELKAGIQLHRNERTKHFAEYSPIYSGSRKERLTQTRELKSELNNLFKGSFLIHRQKSHLKTNAGQGKKSPVRQLRGAQRAPAEPRRGES